ncbi:hypothetical protein LPB137_04030 [Poseidonibacter parvus]|uniref:Uncharacterized protein n=1 Tax=Poseidonibacter parvus TaxID=1850254 RepID=A0A1P8KKJ8_9BACT|nr:hypothetical protein [Poseidonibacter parvus]APW65064.1 hypothetical protein LPB137_04030 [Poseidonibacter parvus]
MEDIVQIKKPKNSKLKYTLIFLTIPIVCIIFFFLTKKEEKKELKGGLASALYKGDIGKNGKHIPSKLEWQDSFKKIDNIKE